jgi:hypothetical protein
MKDIVVTSVVTARERVFASKNVSKPRGMPAATSLSGRGVNRNADAAADLGDRQVTCGALIVADSATRSQKAPMAEAGRGLQVRAGQRCWEMLLKAFWKSSCRVTSPGQQDDWSAWPTRGLYLDR